MNNKENITNTKKIISHLSIVMFLVILIGIAFYSKVNESLLDGELKKIKGPWIGSFYDADNEYHEKDIELPYKDKSKISKQGLTITSKLPSNIGYGDTLFVEGYHQDIQVYIGDELRLSYGGKDLVPFGLVTPSAYTKVNVSEADAGKELKVVYTATYAKHRGNVREIYIGSEAAFIRKLHKEYDMDLIFGSLFILLGVFWICIHHLFLNVFHKVANVNYIGYFGICIGLWVLFESRGSQIFIRDVFFTEKAKYFLLSVGFIPLIKFLNIRQEGRYSRSNFLLRLAMLVNGVVILSLDVLSVIDMSVSQIFTQILVGVMCIYMLVVVALDVSMKKAEGITTIILAFGVFAVAIGIKLFFYMGLSQYATVGNLTLYIGGAIGMIVLAAGNMHTWYSIEEERSLAERANKAKSEFLANMSHEIRTPISAILGLDEMILRENKDSNVESHAIKIKSAGNMLLSIVNDILDFSKIGAGRMEVVPCEYETVPLLNDVICMMKAKAKDKGIACIVNIDSNLPTKLYGDDVRIKQVINNILSNAVKYTRKGSVTFDITKGERVTVEGELRTTITVKVTDTGIGIKEEDMEALFESFKRLDEKRNKNIEGTGLGMSITSYLLEAMGSKLQFNSIYGKGSVFWFDLEQVILDDTPIGDYDKAYSEYEKQLELEHAEFIAPDAKILVVDDNEMNLEVFQGLLQETQMQITTTTRGANALELVKKYRYDLIFLDHMMPEMDGIETLERIRMYEAKLKARNENYEELSIVVLTANAIAGAREMYLKAGFQDYLIKPLEMDEVERVIKKYVPSSLIKVRTKQDTDEVKKPVVLQENSNEDVVASGEAAGDIVSDYITRFGINIDDGIKFSAGKAGKYKLMLGAYIKFDPGRQQVLSQAAEADDMKNYAIEVHALKSNARSIGANKLADVAFEHEKKSKAGDSKYIKDNVQMLFELMDNTVEGVNCILNEDRLLEHEVNSKNNTVAEEKPKKPETVISIRRDSEVTGNIVVGNSDDRKKTFKELTDFINELDHMAAIKLINEVLSKENNAAIKSGLNDIKNCLEEFEFETAKDKLANLVARLA